jgi:restriction system protein
MIDTKDVIVGFLTLTYTMWPLIFFAAILNLLQGIFERSVLGKRKRKPSIPPLKALQILWGMSFLAWLIVFIFTGQPPKSQWFIAEPLNTFAFLALGPILFALDYGLRMWQSQRRRSRATGMSVEDLLELPPSEFEEMVAELYRLFGHSAKVTGRSGDHGVDVVVKSKKSGRKVIVQCKRWRKPVGEKIIREFYGTMHHEKAAQGAIFALSGFSKNAKAWAEGKPISLYSGEDFIKLWERGMRIQTKKKRSQSPAR